MLQNNRELKSKIDQLWNKFWSSGISNPLTAIEQITYLLFMKRLDELDLKRQADAECTAQYLSTITRQNQNQNRPYAECNFLKKPFLDACQTNGLFDALAPVQP